MFDEQKRNLRRTRALILGFIVVVAAMGALFGVIFDVGAWGVGIAVAISLVMTWASYAKGDVIVLRMSRAVRVTHGDQPRLHNIVEGLALAAGIPMPAVYVVEDAAPNAFATGRDPAHASIAVTTGLLEKMNRVELEGVVAHELAHIQNRDTLVMAVTATLVGVLVLLADWTLRGFFWGGGRRRGGRDSGAAVFAIVGIVAALLMPLMARVMQFTISRQREYLADVTSVTLTRYPPGLLSALEKLKSDTTIVRSATRGTNHMWIESPLQTEDGWRGRLNRLFDTHPPLDDRIKILREM